MNATIKNLKNQKNDSSSTTLFYLFYRFSYLYLHVITCMLAITINKSIQIIQTLFWHIYCSYLYCSVFDKLWYFHITQELEKRYEEKYISISQNVSVANIVYFGTREYNVNVQVAISMHEGLKKSTHVPNDIWRRT